MQSVGPAVVDEYIASQEVSMRATLQQLRAIIRSEAPDAEELIAYQVPTYKYHYMLVGFGVTKRECSLYTMSPGLVKSMRAELQGQKVSGATIHFVPGQPLPEALIRKIVRARMDENEARTASKKNSKKER